MVTPASSWERKERVKAGGGSVVKRQTVPLVVPAPLTASMRQ